MLGRAGVGPPPNRDASNGGTVPGPPITSDRFLRASPCVAGETSAPSKLTYSVCARGPLPRGMTGDMSFPGSEPHLLESYPPVPHAPTRRRTAPTERRRIAWRLVQAWFRRSAIFGYDCPMAHPASLAATLSLLALLLPSRRALGPTS